MRLIEIKCPNCGGDLKVNPGKDKLVCGYCHTEFLVDEEIKKIETHHIYTDEARVKKAESEKEIELKKLEIEREEKKRNDRIFVGMIIGGVIIYFILMLWLNFME